MSQIIFNSYIDLQNIAATPSGIGYTVGYDLDGILKQKDQDGVITPVGQTTTQNLSQTLQQGNSTDSYSIVMGTAATIKSANVGSEMALNYGSTSSVLISATISNASARAYVSNDSTYLQNSLGTDFSKVGVTTATFSTQAGGSTFSTLILQDGNTVSILHDDTTIGIGGRIGVFQTGKTYDGVGSENKAYVHINSNSAVTNQGIKNSVVIGGEGLTASKSYTVYLGNSVNINNAYTLPSSDGANGQVLTTDGGGTVSWSTPASQVPTLGQVAAQGNSTGTYSIVMGTGSRITSANGTASIYLDYNGTQKSIVISSDGSLTESYILLDTQGVSFLGDYGYITTNQLRGLVYTADYSATFLDDSLVSKKYVDDNNALVDTYRVAYVDSAYGNNDSAILGREDKPYLTIASASNNLFSTYGNGTVHIKRGEYTELVRLKNNVTYFCESGVNFTQNGFSDVDGAVTSNVYGMASFVGTNVNLVPLNVQNSSTINFEFNRIDNTQVALRASSGTVNFSGRYIKTLCGFASGISVEGAANINVNIDEKILGAYDVVYAKNGFSGTMNIITPKIEVNGDLGASGVQSGLEHAVRVHIGTTGRINVKSDLANISSTLGGGDNSALLIGSGTVSVTGTVDGGVSPGVYVPAGGIGSLSLYGDVSSTRESVVDLSSGVVVKIQNSSIKSDGLGTFTQSIYVNSPGAKLYVSNSMISNNLADSSIVNIATASTVAFYNIGAYSPGTGGNFVFATNSIAVGMQNVRCNKDNSAYVYDQFSPSGFVYDQNFYTPN